MALKKDQMAWIKRHLRTFTLLVSALLLLCTANATRSLTTEEDHILKDSDIWTEKETEHRIPWDESKSEKPGHGSPEMNDLEENCNNVHHGEECLMTRKLAAHVDYVYTQQYNP